MDEIRMTFDLNLFGQNAHNKVVRDIALEWADKNSIRGGHWRVSNGSCSFCVGSTDSAKLSTEFHLRFG